jgi:ParB family transcriptional regulator, chromosome partitioning protein
MAKRVRRLGRGLKSLISEANSEPDGGGVGSEKAKESVPESVPESVSPVEDAATVVPYSDTQVHMEPVLPAGPSEGELDAAMRSATTVALQRGLPEVGPGRVMARQVAIDDLHANRNQPRKNLPQESVSRLAQSIGHNGIIQPIVVRKDEVGFEIIAGERRWRASREAGLREVPVVVRDATDEEMLELALVENIHREDLNAIDRASAYQQLREMFGLSVEEVGKRVGEDRTTVSNYLRLLELPSAVASMLVCGRISMGHARALLGVTDETRMIELASLVAGNGLSVRSLEDVIRRAKPTRASTAGVRTSSGRLPRSHMRKLEQCFEEVLNTRVRIVGGSSGKGRIVIEYSDTAEFEQIAEAMGVTPIVDSDEGV